MVSTFSNSDKLLQYITAIFDSCINNRSYYSEVLSGFTSFKLSRYFLFDLYITNSPFRSIVIKRYFFQEQKGKQIEYILRIYVSKKPLSYVFSFYGIIDLLAIVPFFLRIAIDLRMLRAFRIFRVFRALKLVRYNRALRRFHIAAGIIKEEFVLFFITTGILIFIAASGIYFFENENQPELFKSIFHSLWWAIVTLTTVGYGDVVPITTGGKIFTFFVLILGVGVVTVPAGLVASALSKARIIEQKEREKQSKVK